MTNFLVGFAALQVREEKREKKRFLRESDLHVLSITLSLPSLRRVNL